MLIEDINNSRKQTFDYVLDDVIQETTGETGGSSDQKEKNCGHQHNSNKLVFAEEEVKINDSNEKETTRRSSIALQR